MLLLSLNPQIPTGVQLHNENKLDEMCLIMDHLQQYCPFYSMPDVIQLPDGQNIPTNKVKAWEILLGGDQLTRARAVGAIRL